MRRILVFFGCHPCLQLIRMSANHVVVDVGRSSSSDRCNNRGGIIAGIAGVVKVLQVGYTVKNIDVIFVHIVEGTGVGLPVNMLK